MTCMPRTTTSRSFAYIAAVASTAAIPARPPAPSRRRAASEAARSAEPVARARTRALPLLARRGVSEHSERSERSKFRGVGHGGEHRSEGGARNLLRAPTADLSPDGGSAQAALPRRPWKSSEAAADPSHHQSRLQSTGAALRLTPAPATPDSSAPAGPPPASRP